MPTYDSGRVSTIGGLNIKPRRSTDLEGIRFDANRAQGLPTSANDFILFRHAGSLKVWDGTSTTVIGGSGAAAVPSWESLFAGDTTFNVAGTTWTIDNSTGNNAVLTVTNTGAGTGALIQITNAGTGADIRGDSGTWSVSKAGVVTAVGASFTGTSNALATTGAAVWTLLDNSATSLRIGSTGSTAMITMDTSDAAPTVTFGNAITVTDGIATFISTSNTAVNLMITNNTITTFGVTQAASAGMVVLRSTSLTTGTMLRLQASNTAMTTGFYLECMDSVGGGATEFSIGEDGATIIVGTAAGTAALTLTNGNIVVSAGAISITRAGDAVNLTVTNNTATTASVVVITGSGIHTGTTTTSFMTITPSGMTTGTALYLTAAAATTSVGVVDIISATLSTGSLVRLTTNTAAFTTGGKVLEITTVAAVAGNGITVTTTGAYTGTGQILVTAGAMTTGICLSLVSTTGLTTGSLLRATSSTAGAIATNGAISFTATGAFTSTSNRGFFSVQGDTSTAGTVAEISGTSLTTGVGLYIANGTSAMTSGSLVRVVASGTGTVATNGIVGISHAGIYLSTSNAGLLDVQASALVGAGTLVNFKITSALQTACTALNIEQSGTTTGYTGTFVRIVGSTTTGAASLIGVTAVNTTAGDALTITNNALTLGSGTLVALVHGTSVIGAGSSMLRITSTGIDTGTTTGCLLDLAATAATTGTMVLLTAVGITSGSGMVFNLNGLTTGVGFSVAHTTAVIASGGSLARLSSTSVDTGTTTGNLLDLSSTGALAGTQVRGVFSGLTTGIGLDLTVAALTTGQAISVTAAGAGLTGAGAGLLITANGSLSSNGLIQVSGTGLTTGVGILVTAAAATMTTGAYISCNDGSVNVFRVGLAGHLQSRGTAPTIAVTTANGITAAAIAASNTDTCGTITTTGTNNNGGNSVLTITFTKTYAFAPKVVILPANEAGARCFVAKTWCTSTATTFVLNMKADASAEATPSFHYFVVESGSAT